MAGYRLPDTLVTNRSSAGLTISVFCASLCSFGVIRACELEKEASQRDGAPLRAPLPHGARVPDAATAATAH